VVALERTPTEWQGGNAYLDQRLDGRVEVASRLDQGMGQGGDVVALGRRAREQLQQDAALNVVLTAPARVLTRPRGSLDTKRAVPAGLVPAHGSDSSVGTRSPRTRGTEPANDEGGDLAEVPRRCHRGLPNARATIVRCIAQRVLPILKRA
jgi:hypothetical protein